MTPPLPGPPALPEPTERDSAIALYSIYADVREDPRHPDGGYLRSALRLLAHAERRAVELERAGDAMAAAVADSNCECSSTCDFCKRVIDNWNQAKQPGGTADPKATTAIAILEGQGWKFQAGSWVYVSEPH